ncbi:hypothetical protein GCM10009839_34880 [Catenulispora yoronensis]|uniref:Uncharacterized protein n=1 Tax=Catenulispora yoronensis TaxID=450799 RepID=A0ABN2U8Y9_9ACTN
MPGPGADQSVSGEPGGDQQGLQRVAGQLGKQRGPIGVHLAPDLRGPGDWLFLLATEQVVPPLRLGVVGDIGQDTYDLRDVCVRQTPKVVQPAQIGSSHRCMMR